MSSYLNLQELSTMRNRFLNPRDFTCISTADTDNTIFELKEVINILKISRTMFSSEAPYVQDFKPFFDEIDSYFFLGTDSLDINNGATAFRILLRFYNSISGVLIHDQKFSNHYHLFEPLLAYFQQVLEFFEAHSESSIFFPKFMFDPPTIVYTMFSLHATIRRAFTN